MQFDYDDEDVFDPLKGDEMMSNDDWEAQSFLHNSLDNLPVNLNSPSEALRTPSSFSYSNPSTPNVLASGSPNSAGFTFPRTQTQPKAPRRTIMPVNYQEVAPPAVPCVLDDAIVQAANVILSQEKLLTDMATFQRSFMAAPRQDTCNTLITEQAKLKQVLVSQYSALEKLQSSKLLSPVSMLNLRALLDRVNIQKEQLRLYDLELVAALEQKANPSFALLVIEDQPFPNVYKQHSKDSARTKGFEDDRPVKLRLLTATMANITDVSRVNVDCVFNSMQAQEKVKNAIDKHQADFDVAKGAEFGCNFLAGTRKDMATLKFALAVRLAQGQQVALPAPMSRPFVVISNESQFQKSMKVLFINHVFGTRDSAPWPLVANELAVFFLKATRQNLASPIRGLSPSDLDFVHRKKLGGGEVVPVALLDQFWEDWFGMVLRELRYKRHLLSMWFMGLVYGLVDKESLQAFLQTQHYGTFILRFSETKAGSIAVNAVTQSNQRISNYLIKAEETSPTKTHADYLRFAEAERTKRELTHVLQFLNSYDHNGHPLLRPMEKDYILQAYYSHDERNSDAQYGYDEWDDFSGGPQNQEFVFSFNDMNSSFT